jgi:hypothetical protein
MTELSPVIQSALANHEPHPEHVWLLSSKHVAEGYGCSTDSLRQAKKQHGDELLEGTHWIKQGQKTTWTQRGVIRLGNFIKSAQAAEFRTAAESFLCSAINGQLEPLPSPASASPLAIAPSRQQQLDHVVAVALQARQQQQQQAERDYLAEQYQARVGEAQAQAMQPLADLGQWLAGINGFQLTTEAVEAIASLSADMGAAVCGESAI